MCMMMMGRRPLLSWTGRLCSSVSSPRVSRGEERIDERERGSGGLFLCERVTCTKLFASDQLVSSC